MRLPWTTLAGIALAVLLFAQTSARAASQADAPPLPRSLADTGLYLPGSRRVDPGHLAYSPQYPLWSDGAHKRRWIALPPGTRVDASNPDAWEFPPGTRLWKEFGFGGQPVETRYIERLADGSWRYATYAWNAAGDEALLVGEYGVSLQVQAAPGGRYDIPGRGDCLACHEGARTPVLGFSALQLSPDRDPLAPHAEARAPAHEDLESLARRDLLANLPAAVLANPPRINAGSATARAALGYLHGNCGHCHNRAAGVAAGAPVALSLSLPVDLAAQQVEDLLRGLQAPARHRPHGWPGEPRLVVAGDPDASLLLHRMRSRNPITQMPPLGTRLADAEGLALIERWIGETRNP